ncbi:MAG TPA: chemotaxis protein CheW [Candidatus Wallbacteria bacterium]|nr:chemotaxis protein CheW [Candidatus Wallbacteria bacterium]
MTNISETGNERTLKKVMENESACPGGKFLTFFLGNEEYGIEILKVQEIIGLLEITPVPRMPKFVKGVINLRGHIISLIDLRLKFDMPAVDYGEMTCTIVVMAGNVIMGLIVDRVSEVIDISSNDIEPTPAFGTLVDTRYLLGIGKHAGKVKLLLNIECVLSDDEMQKVMEINENFNENAG